MPQAKRKKAPDAGLYGRGARVLSVFGPFASRTLVEMGTDLALELFPDGLPAAARSDAVDAIERDLAEIEQEAPELAKSALAAAAVAMAYELQNPYNSATSKSMCARALMDALDQLRELAPPKREMDDVDDLERKRAERRAAAGTAGTKDLARP